jgi:CRISPR-associated protein Cmr1
MSRLPDFQEAQPALQRLAAAKPAEPIVLRYTVNLLTPMMGGGVEAGEPDRKLPFRARALRGQLRFWWRVLARGGVFGGRAGADIAKLSAEDWRLWETDIWGGIGRTPEALRASKVGLRVRAGHVGYRNYSTEAFGQMLTPPAGQQQVDHSWATYVYFSAQAEQRTKRPARTLAEAGASFELDIVIKPGHEALPDMVRTVVTMWATFGGVGARTRRGAGAVVVAERIASGTALPLCALGAPWIERCRSIRVIEGRAQNDAYSAFRAAISALIAFRQAPPLGRAGEPRRPRTFGMSFWPEAHEIRKSAQVSAPHHEPQRNGWGDPFPMPRAQFGLPIVVHYKQSPPVRRDIEGKEPADRSIVPLRGDAVGDRMASPLVLRPVACPQGAQVRYRGCALLLDVVVLGDAPVNEVVIVPSGVEEDVWKTWWNADWDRAAPATGVPAIDSYRHGNPAAGGFARAASAPQAFINFFIATCR